MRGKIMKSMPQWLMIGCCGLLLGIGGTFFYTKKILAPQETKIMQNYEEKNKQLEEELQSLKEKKANGTAGEVPIPKHTYSHREYKNLKAIGEEFRKAYYDISTDTAEEKLKKLSKICEPKLAKTLRPAWVDDYKDSFRIEQETVSEQYYVQLDGITGKARMIGCLVVSTKHGSAQAFDVKYIDQFTLEKDENNHWKIKKFEEQIASRDFPTSYFSKE